MKADQQRIIECMVDYEEIVLEMMVEEVYGQQKRSRSPTPIL